MSEYEVYRRQLNGPDLCVGRFDASSADEALERFRHPAEGTISPDYYVVELDVRFVVGEPVICLLPDSKLLEWSRPSWTWQLGEG